MDFSKLDKLPEVIKNLLYSEEVGLTIKNALHLANLEEDKYFSSLMEEITKILIREEPIEKFSLFLKDNLKIEETKQKIIEQIIFAKIFNPILPLLKKETLLVEQKQNKNTSFLQEKLQQFTSFPKKIQFPDFSKILVSKSKPPEKSLSPSNKANDKQQITQINNQQKPQKEIPIITETPPAPLPSQIEKKEIEIEKTEKSSIPKIEIPEPVDIKIEKPLQKDIELPPITTPEVPPDKKEKIKETLLKAMTLKKSETPKIVEEMEKIEKNPSLSKTKPVEIKKKKSPVKFSEVSEVITGKNSKFVSLKKQNSQASQESSVLNIKIKEFEKKEKELPETKEPIDYSKYIQEKEKPFGET